MLRLLVKGAEGHGAGHQQGLGEGYWNGKGRGMAQMCVQSCSSWNHSAEVALSYLEAWGRYTSGDPNARMVFCSPVLRCISGVMRVPIARTA